MSSKHSKTLQEVFETPTKSNIRWSDIEALFIALGGKTKEGNGSRIRVFLNGVPAVFHRPHPGDECDREQVNSIRKFLLDAEINSDYFRKGKYL